MTTIPPPIISYAGPVISTCPLCQKRPVSGKSIYGSPVCKKCFYSFANRRQLDYLVDAILFTVPNVFVIFMLSATLIRGGVSEVPALLIELVVGLVLGCIFCLRDGFQGRSPGKWLTNLQVVNETNLQPISFDQSFKRNAILLIAHVPGIGGLGALVVVVVIAIQVGKGYRLGDRFAKTRVIWKKYAQSPVFIGTASVCMGCGYNLLGNVSGVCPECGKATPGNLPGQAAATPIG